MKILLSIIILICIAEFQSIKACNTLGGDCTTDCDCNSCARSNCCNNCQTNCQGCRTNCCNNCCSCCNECCNNITTSTTPATPTTSVATTVKPTSSTTRPTVSPSVDEFNINIDVKNVINTTNDVKVPIQISLQNTNNLINLLNMTRNSNCTDANKKCKRTSTPKPVVTTTIPSIGETTEELISNENVTDKNLIATPTLEPYLPPSDITLPNDLPDFPFYARPISNKQVQEYFYNQYNQILQNNAPYSQLAQAQSFNPYYQSSYDQFPGFPYNSWYPTQRFPYNSLSG